MYEKSNIENEKGEGENENKSTNTNVANPINTFNPTITINIPPIPVDGEDQEVKSAFRANKTIAEPYTADSFTTVTFLDEQFDLGDEYNSVTTFIPKQDGIYQINAGVVFFPTDQNIPHRIQLSLVVNDGINNRAVAVDAKTISGTSSATVSTIYGLTAGSLVTVVFFATTSGLLSSFSGTITAYFDAARFPFTVSFPLTVS
ncbi:MAG: hypothetical protein HPY50_18310 [Firmicutes bacterium]|nr:hypothetical protein [Bacillota bacterium]